MARAREVLPPTAQPLVERSCAVTDDDRAPGPTLGDGPAAGLTSQDRERYEEEIHERH